MDRIFGLDSVSYHEQGLEHIATVYDPTSLMIMESILKDAQIPYLLKDRGSGGMMKIIAGYSVMGTDIFVKEEQLETARALFENAEFVEENEND